MIRKLLHEFKKLFYPKPQVGTFESIDLTFGQLGQQITKIDGKAYWTWWDVSTWPRSGEKVEFMVLKRTEHYRGRRFTYQEARLLRVISS